MNSTGWEDPKELVGIAAIVGSLKFVGLEMRPSQRLALGGATAVIFENNIEALSEIDEHSSIWARGGQNQDLAEEELVICRNLQVFGPGRQFSNSSRYSERDIIIDYASYTGPLPVSEVYMVFSQALEG